MNHIRYSPQPAESYVRTVDGRPVGPGTVKELINNLAAWNLYWLSFPNLEKHTDAGGGEPLFANLDPIASIAIITANQFAGNTRVADLVVNLTPDRFVAEIARRPHNDLALARFFMPSIWLSVMESRSSLYVPDGAAGAPHIPGSVLTRQQDGTNGSVSTNILPLARIFQLRLH